MKLRTVGLRIALFGLLALVLGAVMVTTGSAGGFAPSEVLAAEKVGVPVTAKPVLAPTARVSPFFPRMVSPFFATPALNGMLAKARRSSSTATALGGMKVRDLAKLETRVASSRAVFDTIPSGYDSVEGWEFVYYAGGDTWYVETYDLWDRIEENLLAYWPMPVNQQDPQPESYVEWSWAIQDEYENDLAWCHGYGSDCADADYFSPTNYQCVGNEYFTTGIVVHYYEDATWKWQYMDWYYNYDLGGCGSE